MLASARGNRGLCDLLLEHGADPAAQDSLGLTAAAVAMAAGHEELGRHLQSLLVPSPLQKSGAASEPVSQSGCDGNDDWLPEDDPVVPLHDASVADSAASIQKDMSRHSAIDRDEDWSDIGIDLPHLLHPPGHSRLEPELRQHLRRLIASAVRAGRVSLPRMTDTLCEGGEGVTEFERELCRHLMQGLMEASVLDDGDPYAALDIELDEPPGEAEEEFVDEVIQYVEEGLSGRHDPMWMWARDVRAAGHLLAHDDEIALGTAIRKGLREAAQLICTDPAGHRMFAAMLQERRKDVVDDGDHASGELPLHPGEEEDPDDEPARLAVAAREGVGPSATLPGFDCLPPEAVTDAALRASAVGLVQMYQLRDRCLANRIDTALAGKVTHLLAGVEAARDRFINSNLRLVLTIARKYLYSGMPLADLVQEGSMGLMRAVDGYDHTRGFRFSTYATWWIRQAVSRAVAEQARLIRLPVHMYVRVQHMEKIRKELAATRHADPSLNEIAAAAGMEPADARKAMQAAPDVLLPGDLTDPDLERSVDPSVPDIPLPDEQLAAAELRVRVRDAVRQLKKKDAAIIRMRFGLESDNELTLEETSRRFEVTRERIRQIERKALESLKVKLLEMSELKVLKPVRADAAASDGGSHADADMATPQGDERIASQRPVQNAKIRRAGDRQLPNQGLADVLRLLSSPDELRTLAPAMAVPELTMEMARQWSQVFVPGDVKDKPLTPSQQGACQLVSAQLHKAVREFGDAGLDVGEMLESDAWQDVMRVSSQAQSVLKSG